MDAPFSKVEEISVRSDGRQVEVTAGDVSFSIRSVEGRYPNYNSVIPKDNPYHVTLPVKDLMNTIRRVSMVASDNSKLIALRRTDLFLQITRSCQWMTARFQKALPSVSTIHVC